MNTFTYLPIFNTTFYIASSSGKTTMLYKILLDAENLFSQLPPNLVVFYSQPQPIYSEIQKLQNFETIKFVKGLDYDFDELQNAVVVIDDMMNTISKSDTIESLFSRLSHHNSVSVIVLNQNLFPKGKVSKDIRLNVHYHIIMKSFSHRGQVKTFGQQLFAGHPKFLPDAYKKGTETKYSYIVVIQHPQWDDLLRVCSNIFSYEDLTVFVPDDGQV